MRIKKLDNGEIEIIRMHYSIISLLLIFIHGLLLFKDYTKLRNTMLFTQSIHFVFLVFGAFLSLKIRDNLARSLIAILLLISPVLLIERALTQDIFLTGYQLTIYVTLAMVIHICIAQNMGIAISFILRISFVIYILARFFVIDSAIKIEIVLFMSGAFIICFLDASREVKLKEEI